jgi:hypothetical protein
MAKAKHDAPEAPMAEVVRMADRLFKMPEAQRTNAIEKAKANLKGKHPRVRDAATVAAASN